MAEGTESEDKRRLLGIHEIKPHCCRCFLPYNHKLWAESSSNPQLSDESGSQLFTWPQECSVSFPARTTWTTAPQHSMAGPPAAREQGRPAGRTRSTGPCPAVQGVVLALAQWHPQELKQQQACSADGNGICGWPR